MLFSGSLLSSRVCREAPGLVAQPGVTSSRAEETDKMLSVRQTFRKAPFQKLPLPLLISCGSEGLGPLPAHSGFKK